MLTRWLARLLRQAVLAALADIQREGRPRRPTSIECWHEGRMVRAAIHGTMGVSLRCHTAQGEVLVRENTAANPDEFWAAWEAWNTRRITFEDGTPYRQ